MPVNDGEARKVLVFVEDITGIAKAKEEIQKRNEELEKFNAIAVDRELRMIELKKKIKELEQDTD
jgi:chromosome segregation ATPase